MPLLDDEVFLKPNSAEVNQTEKIATDWFCAWSWRSPTQIDRVHAKEKTLNSQEHTQSTEVDHGKLHFAGVPVLSTNTGQDKECRENENHAAGVQSYLVLTEVFCSGNQQAAGGKT